jgi:hypothetical protein
VQVVPYNLYLTMFSPAIVNVLCFDPDRRKTIHAEKKQTDTLKPTRAQNHGADQARGYAGKYPAVVNSWVYFTYAGHMRHMSYAPAVSEPG